MYSLWEEFTDDISNLRKNFTIRSALTLISGVVLLGLNIALFVISSKYGMSNNILSIAEFLLGLFGLFLSCLLIFLLSLSYSVKPQSNEFSGWTFLKGVKNLEDKKKKKRIALAVVMAIILAVAGSGLIGGYVYKEAQYKGLPVAEATITGYSEPDDDGAVKMLYSYEVDGKTYSVYGNVRHGGTLIPQIGDKANIRYEPSNPRIIYLQSENFMFLLGGIVALFIGFAWLICELWRIKKVRVQFVISYICLGISAIFILGFFIGKNFTGGIIEFVASNMWLFIVLVFTNLCIIQLLNGLIYLGHYDDHKKTQA